MGDKMDKRNNYYNCFVMAIMSLLDMNGIDTGYLIKDTNIELIKEDNKISIKTGDLLIEDINKNHNIEIEHIKYNNLNISKGLMEKIFKDKACVLIADIYHLRYCIYYQVTHQPHSIEIVEKENGKYSLTDDYYNYSGEICLDELMEVMEQSNESIPDSVSIFYLKNAEAVNYDIDPKQVLSKNYILMNKISIDKNKFYGLSAIKELKKHFEELEGNGKEFYDYLGTIYMVLKDVAMYREGYSKFLNKYSYTILYDKYQMLAKEWLVLANLIIMSSVRSNYLNLKDRIISRLDIIINIETEINDITKSVL